MSTHTITITNFSKSFGEHEVIHDLSFAVKRGEVFAFLGANGSGKTTTLRCLLGTYQPDGGELLIDGQKFNSSRGSMLGYLPEERGLYVNSKVLETMVYFGELKGMTSSDARKFSLDYLSRVGISDKAGTYIKQLSSGQQQKIQLGITIINSPLLLILDEPTKGLDPVNRVLLMDILDELNQQGTTILFSSHQMEEVERIADRLLMIKSGKRKLYGDLSEIKADFGSNVIHIKFSGKFIKNSNLFSARVERNFAEIIPNKGISSTQVLRYLVETGINVREFSIDAPSLNEIFIKVSQSDD